MVYGKMTYIEKELQYIPVKTHDKEVCATPTRRTSFRSARSCSRATTVHCYISDGAESLQTEYIVHLLSRRNADGNLQTTVLDLNMLNSKTAAALAEVFKESLRLTAAILREVGITESMKPHILNFRPDSTMNDRAASARKSARLVRGDPEEGRKVMDGVVRDMMSITDETSASAPDVRKQKAMRSSVGWFSSPSCGFDIDQCAKYVALRS
eukprot:953031-Pleurochrysis_carterae.AAC.1